MCVYVSVCAALTGPVDGANGEAAVDGLVEGGAELIEEDEEGAPSLILDDDDEKV